MLSEFWRGTIQVGAWTLAGVWSIRTTELIPHLPRMANLTALDRNFPPKGNPSVVVVVPARDEAPHIAATIEALLLQDYPQMLVVAIDDRSTDATGAILDELEAKHPARLKAVHITELEDGWLGKTFAMQVAVEQTLSDFILFTDADVLMSPSIIKRALAFAEETEADHLVIAPTMQVKSWDEGVVLGFFQILGMWATRPWRVADPKASRDAIGIGAFNLIRRVALESMGGLEPQRLAVLEDITLGRRIKAAGLRQRFAFAPGLILVHWAKGAGGLVRTMTKNLFSSVNFNPLLMLGVCFWILLFCLVPLAGFAWWWTMPAALLIMLCIAASYRTMSSLSWIDARYGWLYPLGAIAFIYAMLRSMVVTFLLSGVKWRGTLYPIQELRRHNAPWKWEREARARAKLEALKVESMPTKRI